MYQKRKQLPFFVGYCILSKDFKNAKMYYDRLKPKEQNDFLEFPIMHFWEGENRPSAPIPENVEQNKEGMN